MEIAIAISILGNAAVLVGGVLLYIKLRRVDGILQVLGRRAPEVYGDIKSIRRATTRRTSGAEVFRASNTA